MSRAPTVAADCSLIAAQYEIAPGTETLRALRDNFAAATPSAVREVIEEAAKFADKHLAPLNSAADTEGCRIDGGRVRTANGHREAWAAFVDAGWPTLDQPTEFGGQDLPLALATAVQQLFDRGCVAFGMLTVPQRSAAKLLATHADRTLQEEWLPSLISGRWGATICISEPDAGSDVARIRTLARPDGKGGWQVTGEKCWISYGDHDLTPRIAHCLLARTPGCAGLSLFLVPNTLIGAANTLANGVVVRRIEHKLGLHGSPTCALGFENAKAWLIGKEGRGLSQMFVMIANMRLAVGTQGLSVASGAADTALVYARDRRQGGPAAAPPRPIIEHADIQRLLLGMLARVEMLRGLAFAIANQVDLARYLPEESARQDAAALVSWLLPLFKTFGGDTAFEVSSDSIQVLGGAGYTREWPLEQALRDARVFTIYEGTTGIQALDLLHRRLWREKCRGLNLFLRAARADAARCQRPEALSALRCLDLLEDAAASLSGREGTPREAEAGATAFLQLAILAGTAWIAVRLAALDGADDASRRLVGSARYWLSDLAARAQLQHALALTGASHLSLIDEIIPSSR